MLKKLSVVALAGLIALPSAAGAASNAELGAKIEQLTRELAELRNQMEAQEETFAEIEEKAEGWDLASRIQFSGDFRARYDWMEQERMTADTWVNTPGGPFPATTKEVTDKNSGVWTNRFRLDMRVKATENVEFKGRLAMYKAWGMQDAPASTTVWGGFPAFDGTSTRQVSDNAFRVDRAFLNWNNIGGAPIWFSIGRRPTTDGPAAHLRMGMDNRMATPTAYMDWPFDGISMGYAYGNLFGIDDAPGRVRVCYGRGFENGVNEEDTNYTSDTDFIGVSWDIYKKGNRFAYVQFFAAIDVFNYPDFDGMLMDLGYAALVGPRDNIGNIYHTSGVYMDKIANFNYFISAGWSQTDPSDEGMFNDVIGMMMGTATVNEDKENGYNVWVGGRYDFDNIGLKIGAEYNWGSQYWIGMTPGHDDMYSAKLAARGSVYEVYMIYDLPAGEAVSKFGSAFIRIGYQHYEFDYAGGMDWNMMPYELDDNTESLYAAALEAQGMMDTITERDQVYVTFEATF